MLLGLSSSVANAAAGGAGALFFAIMAAASAAAFFCASRACHVLSATNLPAATRLGFSACFVVGVGEVACCVISPCKLLVCNGGAAWVSPCECALSGCAVDILDNCVLSKIQSNLSVIIQQLVSIAQEFLEILFRPYYSNQCVLW